MQIWYCKNLLLSMKIVFIYFSMIFNQRPLMKRVAHFLPAPGVLGLILSLIWSGKIHNCLLVHGFQWRFLNNITWFLYPINYLLCYDLYNVSTAMVNPELHSYEYGIDRLLHLHFFHDSQSFWMKTISQKLQCVQPNIWPCFNTYHNTYTRICIKIK